MSSTPRFVCYILCGHMGKNIMLQVRVIIHVYASNAPLTYGIKMGENRMFAVKDWFKATRWSHKIEERYRASLAVVGVM